jgi:hypothetical protein
MKILAGCIVFDACGSECLMFAESPTPSIEVSVVIGIRADFHGASQDVGCKKKPATEGLVETLAAVEEGQVANAQHLRLRPGTRAAGSLTQADGV